VAGAASPAGPWLPATYGVGASASQPGTICGERTAMIRTHPWVACRVTSGCARGAGADHQRRPDLLCHQLPAPPEPPAILSRRDLRLSGGHGRKKPRCAAAATPPAHTSGPTCMHACGACGVRPLLSSRASFGARCPMTWCLAHAHWSDDLQWAVLQASAPSSAAGTPGERTA